MWRYLTGRLLVACALVATSIVSADACKGASELLRDDFATLDPAWDAVISGGSFEVNGGKLLLSSQPNKLSTDFFVEYVEYENAFLPEADVCVSVVLPPMDLPEGKTIFAGLGFVAGDGSIFIATVHFASQFGKNAAIIQLTSNGSRYLVAPGSFDALDPGVRAANTIRLTWKGPPAAGQPAGSSAAMVSFFINDKLYKTFAAPPNANRKIGLAAATGGGRAEFSHLLATK
jgi:hypothetical protein